MATLIIIGNAWGAVAAIQDFRAASRKPFSYHGLVRNSIVRVTLCGAGTIATFVAVLQCGIQQAGNERGIAYLFSPVLLLLVSGLAWYVARRLKLKHAFLTGAVLPFLLVGMTLGTGAVLRTLQVDVVRGVDAWIGWGIVAVAFYPAVTVWYLSSQLKVRLAVFGTVLTMFASMLAYSWTARERWRYEFWAEEIHQDVVALLEVPGFRMTRGMNVVTDTDTSPIWASVGYLLESDGVYRGQWLYVESDLGPGFEPAQGQIAADSTYGYGLDPEGCYLSRQVKPSEGKDFCTNHPDSHLVMKYKATGFQIFWRSSAGDAATLRALGEASNIRWRSKRDLRYVPLGPAGRSMRPSPDTSRR